MQRTGIKVIDLLTPYHDMLCNFHNGTLAVIFDFERFLDFWKLAIKLYINNRSHNLCYFTVIHTIITFLKGCY